MKNISQNGTMEVNLKLPENKIGRFRPEDDVRLKEAKSLVQFFISSLF